MSFSQENRAAAIAATQGKSGARMSAVARPAEPSLVTKELSEEREPHVSFHATKQVGDFEFHTSGLAGQEDKAKTALDKAAANLRKGTTDS